MVVSFRRGERAVGDDPWGFGNSLEWATSCPPPRHNFVTMPRIRSERPAFDLHHPEAAPPEGPQADPGTIIRVLGPADLGDMSGHKPGEAHTDKDKR